MSQLKIANINEGLKTFKHVFIDFVKKNKTVHKNNWFIVHKNESDEIMYLFLNQRKCVNIINPNFVYIYTVSK